MDNSLLLSQGIMAGLFESAWEEAMPLTSAIAAVRGEGLIFKKLNILVPGDDGYAGMNGNTVRKKIVKTFFIILLASRGWDLNPRPTVYETVALPLSYPGVFSVIH